MGRLAAQISIGVSAALIVTWGVLVFLPWGWHVKETNFFTIHIGILFQSQTFEGTLMKDMANYFRSFDVDGGKTYTIQAAKERYCLVHNNVQPLALLGLNFGRNLCESMTKLWGASMAMLITTVLACAALAVGASATWYYYHVEARHETRRMARTFFAAAGCLQTMGILAYFALTHDLFDWMPAVLGANTMSFDLGAFVGAMAMILTWIPLIISVQYAKEDLFEEVNKAMEAERNERMREQLQATMDGAQAGYGSAQYGGAPYGGAPYGGAPYGGAPYGGAQYGGAQYGGGAGGFA